MEKLLNILTGVKPYIDAETFLNTKDLYGEGVIDSLDILMILEEINVAYEIEIDAAGFTKEDFRTVNDILNMIKINGG